jgi:hypothetical protein
MWLAEDIGLASQALAEAHQNGVRLRPNSPGAIQNNWRVCITSPGETPIAYIDPHGEFFYNRAVLGTE